MNCVNCGERCDEPVWAVYADEAFKDRGQAAFPVHQACFDRDEHVTIAEWQPIPDSDEQELVERVILRYREATDAERSRYEKAVG